MRRMEQGFSLVEMMVGMALGLVIVGIATTLLVSRIHEHRAMLLEARLMHDLRTSAELISRDLRRAGYWGAAGESVRRSASTMGNPYAAVAPMTAASDAIAFRFSRDEKENNVVDTKERFGFRLRGGAIQMLIGDGSWQALTDTGTMTVTQLQFTPGVRELPLETECETACPAGMASCRAVQQVRSVSMAVTAHAVSDPSVVRTLRSHVRLRNDAIVESCAA